MKYRKKTDDRLGNDICHRFVLLWQPKIVVTL